jgi:long-chain acyl-CoA synthetase
VKIGEDQELLTKGPNVMLGYWRQTDSIVDAEGWLHTGDQARIDDHGRIFIIGRIKDIIVLSSGEKVPPEDLQMDIVVDPLFEQAIVIGENRPFLTAIVVLNPSQWKSLANKLGIDPEDSDLLNSPQVQDFVLKKIAYRLKTFPGYAKVHRVHVQLKPWSIDSGLITASLKVRREKIAEQFSEEIEAMYSGH